MKWSVCFERLDPVKTKFTKYGWSTHAKRGQFRGIWWLCSVSHCPSPPLHKKTLWMLKKIHLSFQLGGTNQEAKQKNIKLQNFPHFLKSEVTKTLTHQTFRRKMVVSFKWYPSCLTHPGSPLKGDIPDKYPLYKVSFGVDYLGGFPHHFP